MKEIKVNRKLNIVFIKPTPKKSGLFYL